MEIPLISEGREYISASRAARETGYHSDYIGQLCRGGKIPGKLIGRTWYVDLRALLDHKDKTSQKKQNSIALPSLRTSTSPHDTNFTFSALSTEQKPIRDIQIVYASDDGPRLPELLKKSTEHRIQSTNLLVQEYVALTLGLILFIGTSVSVIDAVNPRISQALSKWSTLGVSQGQLAAVSAFDKFGDSIKFFLNSFNLPQFGKKAPATVKLAVEQNSPTLDFEALKSDLRLELQDFIRNVIPGERSQVVIRELQPIINTTVLREEILRSDTRPVISRQSDSDADRRGTITARISDGASFTNSTITSANVSGPTGAFTNFTFTTATGTSATTTNLFSTTASSTSLFATVFNFGSGVFGNSTSSNATSSSLYVSGLASSTDFRSNTATIGTLTSGSLTSTNILANASTTLQNFTAINSTSTSATTTNIFSTTASSTNLFSASATLGALTLRGAVAAAMGSLNIGSSGTRFGTIYADSIDATNLIGTVVTGSTSANDWTINSDNATADTESMTLAFERGSITPNALLTWNATLDQFEFNNSLLISGNSTSTNATTTNFFSTTASSTNLYATNLFSNTSNLSEGTNLFYTDARVNSYIHSSSTIPKTYSANTFTGAQIFDAITRSTTTGATSTNSFATTASSTNLFYTTGNGGNLTLGTITLGGDTIDEFVGTGLALSSGDVTVDQAFTPTWTGAHIFNNITRSTTTSATTTNLFSTTASSTNLFSTSFNFGSGVFGNSTSSNATTTNFFSTTASSTNLFATTFNFGSGVFGNSTSSNATTSAIYVSGLASSTDLRSNTATIGTLTSGSGTFTNLLLNASSTLQNFTFINATGTSATTTNFFSTNASSTNIFATAFNFGSGVFGNSTSSNATTTNFFSTTASSTNLFYTTGNAGILTLGNLVLGGDTIDEFVGTGLTLSSGDVTVDQSFAPTWTGAHIFNNITRSTTTSATTTNFFSTTASSTNLFSTSFNFGSGVFGNSTSSNATTSALYVSGLASSTDLRSNTGTVGTLTVGSCTGCGGGAAFAWTPTADGNSTSTRIILGNGFISQASSTISANLTITGNSTTTNATTTNFFSTTASSTNLLSSLLTVGGTGLVVDSSRNVGIGTTTPTWLLNPTSATAPQLALSSGAGFAQWAFRNIGGNLLLATTTVAGTATSSLSALSIIGSTGNLSVLGSILPNASPNAGASSQTITTVDSTNTVGQYTSIAIGSDGLPVISYAEATSWDLKVTKCGNAACSSGNTTTTVDSDGVVGEYTSIAIGTDGFPVISYHDGTNANLKVAKCGNAACSSGNTLTAVSSTGDVGDYNSITIGSDGFPVISYYDVTNADLKVLKCGNAACSSGNTDTAVSTTNDTGQYTSIKIGSDSLPIISYYYVTGGDLYVTHCGNLACSSGNTTTALVTTNDVGQYSSIAILPNGIPFISFYDNTAGDLRYQICNDILCTGAPGGTSVEATNNIGQYISMAIGSNGFPIISYYDVTNGDLRVAECTTSNRNDDMCSTNTGSVKTSVDTTGDVGKYTSITIAPDGLPVIAYYDVTNADLKIIKCALPDCSQTAGGSFTGGSNLGGIGTFFNNIYANSYWGKKFQIANFDLAEDYIDINNNLSPGDIVSLSNSGGNSIELASTSTSERIIGVISTKPAIVLGDWPLCDSADSAQEAENCKPKNTKPVALSGRVPVKVTTENGSITIGDHLTLSETEPGKAMKMTEPGTSIGIALDNFEARSTNSETGKVMTFVNLQYWIPGAEVVFNTSSSTDASSTASTSSPQTTIDGLFGYILNKFSQLLEIVFEKGIMRIAQIFTDQITTKKLCIEDVCVNKDQLKALLLSAGANATSTENIDIEKTQNTESQNTNNEQSTETENTNEDVTTSTPEVVAEETASSTEPDLTPDSAEATNGQGNPSPSQGEGGAEEATPPDKGEEEGVESEPEPEPQPAPAVEQ